MIPSVGDAMVIPSVGDAIMVVWAVVASFAATLLAANKPIIIMHTALVTEQEVR